MRQPLVALARANHVKRRAKTLHRQLKTGECDLSDVLAEPALKNYRLGVVMGWQHRVGPAAIDRIIQRAGVRPMFLQLPISRLTARQREALGREAKGKKR